MDFLAGGGGSVRETASIGVRFDVSATRNRPEYERITLHFSDRLSFVLNCQSGVGRCRVPDCSVLATCALVIPVA